VRYNPAPDKQNSFIVGTANRRINQYDTVTGKKVQIYDEHLGAVNSILFVDDYRKFISTSDDKKIFLWEFGIPVVVKHISEPHMHAVPYTALHPSNRHFVGQSLDNKLVVFEARGGFRLNRRKRFEGHMNGGFACAISFSPDGKFVASGDFNGRVWFWDWKTTRNFKTLEAHDDVVLGLDWHPVIPSRVATCSWDGVIKIWD
jgi:pre-mRNA-processing factor 17